MPNPDLPETITAGASGHLAHSERLHVQYNKPAPVVIVAATSYTLLFSDASSILELTATSSITVTVPPDSSVSFPIGTIIGLYQRNTGAVTVAPGAGVTIQSAIDTTGSRTLAGRYVEASLRKRALNIWVLTGDLL